MRARLLTRLDELFERVRAARAEGLPIADARALEPAARRSRAIRVALAVGLVTSVTAAAFAVPDAHGRRFLPADTVGIVVLDLSSSIRPSTYRLIGQELRDLASTDQRVGVVYFSDVAYEAMPPGTPASELRSVARYFDSSTVKHDATGYPLPRSPWEQWFSAGTSISSGLGLAADLLAERHVRRGGVVLISDLADDPGDLRSLGRTISLYEQRHLPLRVVALDPAPEDRQFWIELLNRPGAFFNVELPRGQVGRGKLVVASSFPTRVAFFATVAVLLLAVNAFLVEPITWRGSSV